MSRARHVLTMTAASVVSMVSVVAITTAPAAAVGVDQDGDGFAAGDCAPLDPSIHPGAVDLPDPGFVDSNCDGIDGDAAKAVFVSLGGNDLAPGTLTNPKRTITSAVAAAATSGKDVYVAGGTYDESVALASGVGVYGGYAPITGVRSSDEPTVIAGAPAVLASGVTGVVLQMLTLHGLQDTAGNSYGLRAVPSGPKGSQVALDHVVVTADPGGAGPSGPSGANGFPGAGVAGGAGGAGGCGAGVPGAPGLGSGLPGQNGANAVNQPQGALADLPTWSVPFGATGQAGSPGDGGRGGTGGTGQTFLGTLCGGPGGVGGPGGGGGFGGAGGRAGGGSFGVYALNSSIVAIGTTISAANGGAGGNGGNGGSGAVGLAGRPGLAGDCQTFVGSTVCAGTGFAGGLGGSGGHGGGGGGGAGGPSVAVYQAGAQSGYVATGSTLASGAGGQGGLQGNGTGQRAATGQSADLLRTPTAPATSTSDFDGDGINDGGDACPVTPRGSADANGDGCPEAPETTVTSGPADHGFLLTTATKLGFASSEAGSTFTCSFDSGAGTPCASPRSLTGLSARTHVLDVWATDGAGDADATPATRSFTVPISDRALRHSRGWALRMGKGHFLDKYSTSTTKGASLSTTVSGARQIALVATKAPRQGKVSVYLGKRLLRTVSLSAARAQKRQLVAVATFPTATSGTVRVVVATAGKQVQVEGLGVATG